MFRLQFGVGPVLDRVPGRPLLQISHIKSVKDLHGFFHTISVTVQAGESISYTEDPNSLQEDIRYNGMPKSKSAPEFLGSDPALAYMSGQLTQRRLRNPRVFIEQMIEGDFLEPVPRS